MIRSMTRTGSGSRAALAAFVLLASAACGSEEAGRRITVPGAADGAEAYLTLPPGDGPYPGLLLVPDERGLDTPTRRDVDRLARERFVTLALAWRGSATADPSRPADTSGALHAAFRWLRTHPRVGGRRIGIIGRGRGADAALRFAAREPQLATAVLLAPRSLPGGIALEEIQASLLGIFGDPNPALPTERVRALHQRLRELGKDADLYIYANAGPTFMDPAVPGYLPDSARDADRKVVEYLRERLYRAD